MVLPRIPKGQSISAERRRRQCLVPASAGKHPQPLEVAARMASSWRASVRSLALCRSASVTTSTTPSRPPPRPSIPCNAGAFLQALAVVLERHPRRRSWCCAPLRRGPAEDLRRRGAQRDVALRRAATPQSSPGGPLSRKIGKLQVRLRQHLRTKRGQRGKLGATPSAVGISTRAKARSCSPKPTPRRPTRVVEVTLNR
jgi:hypothetical protein